MKSRNTFKLLAIGLLVVLLGVLSLWLAEVFDGTPAALLAAIGSLMVVTGAISILWDLQGKRDLVQEVQAQARLGADIAAAGLKRVTMRWLEDVEWDKLFRDAASVEVFVAYGRSWRGHHASRLEQFLSRAEARLSLYLPDPGNDLVVRSLAARFDTTPEKVRSDIEETAREFAVQSLTARADVLVYYRPFDPVYACYRFDRTIVATLYSHKRRRGDVPTFLVDGGTLYNFFAEDLEAIRLQSVAVDLEKLRSVGGPDAGDD